MLRELFGGFLQAKSALYGKTKVNSPQSILQLRNRGAGISGADTRKIGSSHLDDAQLTPIIPAISRPPVSPITG